MLRPFPFLRAEWRSLLFLNFEADADLLRPYLPDGTELDLWEGRPLMSMVGLQFRKARALGVPVPFHTRFDQVNLRFYVRATRGKIARRGVVFIKEIIPRYPMARAARLLGENYYALPTGSTVEMKGGAVPAGGLVEYHFRTPRGKMPQYAPWVLAWLWRKQLNRMGALGSGQFVDPLPGSEEEFVTRRHWSFTRRGPGSTLVMHTDHPQWRVQPVTQPYLLCDVKTTYGEQFVPYLHHRPRSALLVEGSPMTLSLGYENVARAAALPDAAAGD